MSQALRDAIASVRRVSHHAMPETPLARADRGRYAPRFDETAVEQASFHLAESDARPFVDEEELREEVQFDHPAAAEQLDDQAVYEESPPAGTYPDPQEALEQAAAVEEWPARSADRVDASAWLAEDPPLDDWRLNDGPDAPLPFGGRARPGRSSSGVRAAPSAPFDDDEADQEPMPDGGWDGEPLSDGGWEEESLPSVQEAARDRAPQWRGGTQRPGLHLTTLMLVPLFVLVAGIGLGILSGAQGFDRVLTSLGWTSLGDGTAGAPPTRPAPPAASSARSPMNGVEPPAPSVPAAAGVAAARAEPEPSPRLSELETVRVAPAPAPPTVERSAADPATSDMPLPPPPKPAPWSSPSAEASGASDPIESAANTAAVALPATDGTANDAEDAAVAAPKSDRTANDAEDAAVAALESDGADDPFEPILIKSSVAEPRVFVHYTESARGSPAAARHLVRQLRAAGFEVEERPVEISIRENSIRYFFPGDRDEAEALSAEFQSQAPGGAAVTILDLTSYEPKPRRGHLEVWLRG